MTTIRNLFDKKGLQETIDRINQLTPSTTPAWGKMNVSQMLAHINVAYEMTYEDIHKKPGAFARFMLKLIVKKPVVNEAPYPKNGRTAPQFIISDERDFEKEKGRLIAYMTKTQELGMSHFDQKESHSFGPLTVTEWNNMFSKHIDHHLTQFGV